MSSWHPLWQMSAGFDPLFFPAGPCHAPTRHLFQRSSGGKNRGQTWRIELASVVCPGSRRTITLASAPGLQLQRVTQRDNATGQWACAQLTAMAGDPGIHHRWPATPASPSLATGAARPAGGLPRRPPPAHGPARSRSPVRYVAIWRWHDGRTCLSTGHRHLNAP